MTNLPKSRIFISGAAGYIGGHICRALTTTNAEILGGTRTKTTLPAGVTPVITGDLADSTPDLTGATTVIHAAGLGHRRGAGIESFRRANVTAAINLACAARQAGAEKFVLISTAYIHGRIHEGPLTDTSPPNPMDSYAASKLEAEARVTEIFGGDTIIIRPTAVIGPHCPGNLNLLLKLLTHHIPLPLASINNQRSFIPASDLANLVIQILTMHAPPKIILAAHPAPISTPTLIHALATGLNTRARLIPCPKTLLILAATATNRTPMVQSLTGNFIAIPSAALSTGWRPAETLSKSLAETAAAYAVK